MSNGPRTVEMAAYEHVVEADRSAKDAFFRTSPHSPINPSARATFGGLAYFAVDADYHIIGLRLDRYLGNGPVAFMMPTSDGRNRDAHRVGSLVFGFHGDQHTLTAYRFPGAAGDALFVPFLDATSGGETYGAGRYLDLEAGPDGTYVLDFNLAYHPYCAYSPDFSCPLTPAENRLDVRIEAGERLAAGH